MEGICGVSTARRTVFSIMKGGYNKPDQLLNLSMDELHEIEGVSHNIASRMFSKNFQLRNQGDIFKSIFDIEEIEKQDQYISSGCMSIDEMLSVNGKMGFKTRTITQVTGPSKIGKTQLCLTVASKVMGTKKSGGLDRAVLWLDGKGDFHSSRLYQIGIKSRIKPRFKYVYIEMADDMEYVLDTIIKGEGDYGLIVIDTLFGPIKRSYPVWHMHTHERATKLIRLFKKMKKISLDRNCLVLFTNTEKIERRTHFNEHIPDGGLEVDQGSDLIIRLDRPNSREIRKNPVEGLRRARILSGMHPETRGFFTITSKGVVG